MAGELGVELFSLSKSCGVSVQGTIQRRRSRGMFKPKRSERADASMEAALDYAARCGAVLVESVQE